MFTMFLLKMCPFHSGSLLLTLLNWLQLCRRSNLVMRGVDLVWVLSIWFVSAFVKIGYNDRSHANWVRGGEYSLRWPLYFVEAALQRCSFLAATIRPHHSTPDLQSTKGRPREQEQKTRKSATGNKPWELHLKELFEGTDKSCLICWTHPVSARHLWG